MYIVIGMASLGALIGLFVVWSASPIAMTALPLIFGLIGGAGGFSVTKLDVTQPASVLKLKLLGQTLAAFSLACIVGVVGGILLRPTLSALENPQRAIEIPGHDDPQTIIDNIVLRKKLELVGASKDEIANLFTRIKTNSLDDSSLQPAINRLDTAIRMINRQAVPGESPPHFFAYEPRRLDPWDLQPNPDPWGLPSLKGRTG